MLSLINNFLQCKELQIKGTIMIRIILIIAALVWCVLMATHSDNATYMIIANVYIAALLVHSGKDES